MAEQIPDLNLVENSSDTSIATNYYKDVVNFSILNKSKSIETSSNLILNKISGIRWFIKTCKINLNKSASLSSKAQLKELYKEINYHGSWFIEIFNMMEKILLRSKLLTLNTSFSTGFYSMKNILDNEYKLLEKINTDIVTNKSYMINSYPSEKECENVIAKVVDALERLQGWVDVENYLVGQATKIAESQAREKPVEEEKKGFFSKLFGFSK